ncbi:hypothetical protein PGT21_017136 [Puccinia graminis f. sp. tritici]|uniref:Uncharacterized protein n=1 Tax=Puccinia graminis f. sp. tritici TaxID=56615 RepID=A0A5B0RFM4_PUCGR|nr:hypothetical protein PGT21_017136 [Puccinia graminis f. sp. tritici]KAA1124681.1 hypothetical protein PGTUg99_028816 [Puccinia graminis f. sp. tritici]
MTAAVLLHNMIIEDERDTPVAKRFDYHTLDTQTNDPAPPRSTDLEMFLLQYQAIRSRMTHTMLKEDLVDHLWKKKGEEKSKDGDESSEEEDED